MKIKSVKTKKFYPQQSAIDDLLPFISNLSNQDIVAISSKVLSICEGNCIPSDSIDKDALVKRYADKILTPESNNKAHMELTILDGLLIESAGIDQSNGAGFYILPLNDPYKTAKELWKRLRKLNNLKELGVIITDSHSVPGQRGSIGMSICAYGFKPVKTYHHKTDAFRVPLDGAGANLSEALAAAAVVEMGEGGETKPIAIISDLKDIEFYRRGIAINRQKKFLYVSPNRDVYGRLLESSLWQRVKKR